MGTIINPILKSGDKINININRYNLNRVVTTSIAKTNVNEVLEMMISQVHSQSFQNIESQLNKVLGEFCSCKLDTSGTYKYKDKVMTQADYYLVIQKFNNYKQMYLQLMQE